MNDVTLIRQYAKQLRLTNLANKTFDFLSEPVSNEEYLKDCLHEEIMYREGKAKLHRTKKACLPTYKGFEDFDTDFQTGITDWQLKQLAGLNWLDGIYNLIIIGPPGTGKTHLALAIGNKAVETGYKVFFSSMDSDTHTEDPGDFTAFRRKGKVDKEFGSPYHR